MDTQTMMDIAKVLQIKNDYTHVTVTPYAANDDADNWNRWEVETGATTQYLSVRDEDGELNITLLTHNGVIVSYAKLCWVDDRIAQSVMAGLLGLED